MKKVWIALLMLPVLLGLSTCTRMETIPDYHALLVQAAAEGDAVSGRALAAERNALIHGKRLGEMELDFDELLLLSRLIYAQAGERKYSEDYRFCVGEVALNRVASPEFPDTLEEVAYQRGQYLCTLEPEFAVLRPSENCARIALRLLLGERHMAPQVLYQSQWRIGPAYVRFYDRILGYTYFCESVYSQLYEDTDAAEHRKITA